MNPKPKKQHFVPKVYLKEFAHNKKTGDIYRLDIKSKYKNVFPKLSNISRICIEPDCYTIETQELLERYEIRDPYFIERNVFDYENSFISKIIKKVTRKRQINLRDARKLIATIISIKRRNKAFRVNFHDDKTIREIKNNQILSLRISEEKNKSQFLVKGVDISGISDRIESWMNEMFSRPEYKNDLYREGFLVK